MVPEVVQRKARAIGATQWLADLPGLVGELAARWGLTLGRVYGGGTEALVTEVTLPDGTPAVLKLNLPGREPHELTAYRLAGGDGLARLLRADEEHDALLLERLGRPLCELGVPARRRHAILADTAQRIWRPAAGHGLPDGAEKAAALSTFIQAAWEETGRPCSRRAVEHALRCAERRRAAHDDERAVLAHGDVHQWNALQAGDGFKLVDPDGLLIEPEYDLGVIMREDPLEDDLDARLAFLARRTGTDPVAIREWGDLERVSTGLLCEKIDLQPVGVQMLVVAERVSA
jgi:streptomycin 6-kinase